MRLFARIILVSTLIVISHQSLVTKGDIHAAGEFQTDYKVNYTTNINGRTDVTQNITLKNKTANFYADKFELKIGSTKVDNVKAQDSTGPMPVDVKFDNNVTTISTQFNQRVIGIDKTLSWTLQYSSSELATKSGQIWEVSIPRLADSQDINNYEATLSTPTSFGPIAFAVPTPLTQIKAGLNQEFTFDKSQLTKSGISISFGDRQVFSFNLDYYLENKNLTSLYQEIAIPPDNNYQKIFLEKIDPEPLNVTVDPDGNFLARYKLSPNQKIAIRVSGSVEVSSSPTRNIDQKLTGEQIARYTSPQKFWETDNSFISDKADKLKTPQEIYDFVTSYLSYNEERLKQPKLERQGAAKASISPNDAVCTEFTDLFIAIARRAGIPAREVEGFAYTQNERLRPLSLATDGSDLLHAWPEYWDDNLGWVQIDPTWASTSGGLDYFHKMDFNHITFIQRGVSSTYPVPAGGYKTEHDLDKKSVFVEFAQELPQSAPNPVLELQLPSRVIAGVPVKASATVKNIGSSSIFGETITLNTEPLKNISQNPIIINILPPHSNLQAQYSLQTKGFLTRQTVQISSTYDGINANKSIEVVPIYYLLFSPLFGASLTLAVIIIIAGLLLFRAQKSRRTRSKIL